MNFSQEQKILFLLVLLVVIYFLQDKKKEKFTSSNSTPFRLQISTGQFLNFNGTKFTISNTGTSFTTSPSGLLLYNDKCINNKNSYEFTTGNPSVQDNCLTNGALKFIRNSYVGYNDFYLSRPPNAPIMLGPSQNYYLKFNKV